MEAPEDEETFDILNDETFGDMGDGKIFCNQILEFTVDTLICAHPSSSTYENIFAGDYNWEEEHEKFSSFHKDIGESENHDNLSSDQYGLHEVCL